jgi:hypothetical protein
MSVLVTGSSGHLGEAVVRTLRERGADVLGLTPRPSKVTTASKHSRCRRSRHSAPDTARPTPTRTPPHGRRAANGLLSTAITPIWTTRVRALLHRSRILPVRRQGRRGCPASARRTRARSNHSARLTSPHARHHRPRPQPAPWRSPPPSTSTDHAAQSLPTHAAARRRPNPRSVSVRRALPAARRHCRMSL